jgi:hypothetical protein
MENEDVMHNLYWILVNAVINVHVSVQLSDYARKTLLKLQHDNINFRDILNMTINIISLNSEAFNQSKSRKKYTKGYRTQQFLYNINIATCFELARSSSGYLLEYFKGNIQTAFT